MSPQNDDVTGGVREIGQLLLKTEGGTTYVIDAPDWIEASMSLMCRLDFSIPAVRMGAHDQHFAFGTPGHGLGVVYYLPVDFKADGFNPMTMILERCGGATGRPTSVP